MTIREIKEKYAYLYNNNNQLIPVLIFSINTKAKDNVIKEQIIKYGTDASYYIVGLKLKNEKQIPLDELDDYFEIDPIFPTTQRWFVSKWNKISLYAWEIESPLFILENQHLAFSGESLNIFSEATIELNNQLVSQHYQQEIILWKEEKKQRKLAKKMRKEELKASKKAKKL